MVLVVGVVIVAVLLLVLGLGFIAYRLRHPVCPSCGARFTTVVPVRPRVRDKKIYRCTACGIIVSF